MEQTFPINIAFELATRKPEAFSTEPTKKMFLSLAADKRKHFSTHSKWTRPAMLTNTILVYFVSVCLVAFVVELLCTRRTNNIPFSAAIRSSVRVRARMCSFHAFYICADPAQRHCLLYVVHAVYRVYRLIVFIIVFRFVLEKKTKNSRFDTITRAQLV